MNKAIKWIISLVIILLFGIGINVLLREYIPIATGYSAKNLCTCVFVANREPAVVNEQDLNSFKKYVHSIINYEDKSVTSEILFGMVRRKAVYREGLGCTLLSTDKDLVTPAQDKDIPRSSKIDGPYPFGDKTVDTAFAQIDYNNLNKTVSAAFSEPNPDKPRLTRAVLVIYDGYIIAERYSEDNGITMNTPLAGWSMTKTITNALVGTMVKKGLLDVNTPAPIEEWKNDERSKITLDHLLRMSSGLEFEEVYVGRTDATDMLFKSFSTGEYALNKPLEKEPGSVWYYSSGTTNIISKIICDELSKAGVNYASYPKKALFNRLGIESAVMEMDQSGRFVGSSFMFATARDWGRLGLLYYNDGIWGNDTIFPAGWVKYSITPAPADTNKGYGAQIWLNAGGIAENVPKDAYWMSGYEGQNVVVIPSKKLVVVRLGLSEYQESWDKYQFISDIVASVRD